MVCLIKLINLNKLRKVIKTLSSFIFVTCKNQNKFLTLKLTNKQKKTQENYIFQ